MPHDSWENTSPWKPSPLCRPGDLLPPVSVRVCRFQRSKGRGRSRGRDHITLFELPSRPHFWLDDKLLTWGMGRGTPVMVTGARQATIQETGTCPPRTPGVGAPPSLAVGLGGERLKSDHQCTEDDI